MSSAEIFAVNIKEERDERGWSKRKLAKKADVHHVIITRIENGHGCTFGVMDKICGALEVDSWAMLMEGAE